MLLRTTVNFVSLEPPVKENIRGLKKTKLRTILHEAYILYKAGNIITGHSHVIPAFCLKRTFLQNWLHLDIHHLGLRELESLQF